MTAAKSRIHAPGLDERAPLASEGAPELDLETRQADTPAGTIDAERSSAVMFVGAAGGEAHIAVTHDEGVDAGFPQRALVYLCDGVHADYITGEIGIDATTQEGAAWDVELTVGEACWRCCSGESCHICCPTTADTAGPTVDWRELQYWWRKWRE